MTESLKTTDFLPTGKHRLHLSKTAIALILATALIGLLLAFSAYQNINREKRLMADFLYKKGEIIARSVEAGTRTAMMHHGGTGNPLDTLIKEHGREEDVIFVTIIDSKREVIAKTGNLESSNHTQVELNELLESGSSHPQLDLSKGVYIYTRQFRPNHPHPKMAMRMMQKMGWQHKSMDWGNLFISVGISTEEFDLARKEDMNHTLLMGAILFLIGTAGLYFVFLYQGMRVASHTLSNMKVYTQNVIESMPAGLLTLNSSNTIVSCNQNCADILGMPLSNIQQRNVRDILTNLPESIEKINELADVETYHYTKRDGSHLQLKVYGSNLRDHTGESVGSVLTLQDVTTLREMEKQLELSRRMASLGKMATGIAHEIRNPLGTLKGFAQFFGNQPGQSGESKEYASLMVSEVDRLDNTVSSLLQFARPREPEFREVKIDQLFAKTYSLMAPDFAAKSQHFSMSENTDITITADGDLLLQVLLNLLKNSISATDQNGRITLNALLNNNAVVTITVTDNGKGVGKEEKERMFDPFFTTKKTGTGLGLAVTHQIIEQHNGNIEVSSSPGKGCTISLNFPLGSAKGIDYES